MSIKVLLSLEFLGYVVSCDSFIINKKWEKLREETTCWFCISNSPENHSWKLESTFSKVISPLGSMANIDINNPFHLVFLLHHHGVNHKLKKISNQWLREFITGCQNIWKHSIKMRIKCCLFTFGLIPRGKQFNSLFAKCGKAYCSQYNYIICIVRDSILYVHQICSFCKLFVYYRCQSRVWL